MDLPKDLEFLKTILLPWLLGSLAILYGCGALAVRRINVRYSRIRIIARKPAYLVGWLKGLHGLSALTCGIALLGIGTGSQSTTVIATAVGGALLTVLTALVPLFGRTPDPTHPDSNQT